MKFLFDFFPIVLFFVVYKFYGIYAATTVAIVAALLQNSVYYLKHKKFETMHLITLAVIIVLGGLTLILHNKTFIMWKPTVVYWAFALALFASQVIYNKPLVKRMMGSIIEVPDNIWRTANYGMTSYFIFLGVANIYVANFYFKAEAILLAKSDSILDLENCTTHYTGQIIQLCQNAKDMEDVWVNFKLFGTFGLMLAAIVILTIYLYMNATNKDEDGALISLDKE